MGTVHASSPLGIENQNTQKNELVTMEETPQSYRLMRPLVFMGKILSWLPWYIYFKTSTNSPKRYRWILYLCQIFYTVCMMLFYRYLSGQGTMSTSQRFMTQTSDNSMHKFIEALNIYTTVFCMMVMWVTYMIKGKQLLNFICSMRSIDVVLTAKALPKWRFYIGQFFFIGVCAIKGGLAFGITYFEGIEQQLAYLLNNSTQFTDQLNTTVLDLGMNVSNDSLIQPPQFNKTMLFKKIDFRAIYKTSAKAGLGDTAYLITEFFPGALFVCYCAIFSCYFSTLADHVKTALLSSRPLVPTLRVIRGQYQEAYCLVAEFLNTFQFLMTITIVGNTAYVLFINYFIIFRPNVWSFWVTVDSWFLMIIAAARLWVIISAADAVITNAKKPLNDLCDIKKTNLESDERMQLRLLIDKLSLCPIEITASGFFTLNRSFFISILGLVATYLIVLAQFHKDYQ